MSIVAHRVSRKEYICTHRRCRPQKGQLKNVIVEYSTLWALKEGVSQVCGMP
jgi:hypothetical protein